MYNGAVLVELIDVQYAREQGLLLADELRARFVEYGSITEVRVFEEQQSAAIQFAEVAQAVQVGTRLCL